MFVGFSISVRQDLQSGRKTSNFGLIWIPRYNCRPAFRRKKGPKGPGTIFSKDTTAAKAVLLAFSDLLESQASAQLLATLGSGFGGGMARMREVCGSFSGAVMMAGFISPADDPSVKAARTANYAMVQKMAEQFKELNGGSIVCGELLGLRKRPEIESPEPSDRTAEYYRKRPCPQIIYNAALIVARTLLERQNGTAA